MQIDILEQENLDGFKLDLTEKLDALHQSFVSKVKPERGVYGVTEKLRDDGVLVKTGKNELNHTFREYYKDGNLFRKREILGKGRNLTTEYDNNGTPYAYISRTLQGTGVRDIHTQLEPNAIIKKGNFTARTDAYGRPISNKMTDVKIYDTSRKNIAWMKNESFGVRDQLGHLIAHIFGGPDSPENIVAQLDEVNQGKMKQVENLVRRLKNEGHTIDYEVRSHYDGTQSRRPTSFEPVITVDGKTYTELPKELQKIYNKPESELTAVNKAAIAAGEKFGVAHELGMKSGLTAAGLTLAVTSAGDIAAFANGEISGEEMASDIVRKTTAAGALGYGSTFITASVSKALSEASSELLKKVGGSCLPAAAVSFAVDSYDSISEFAQGKMDGAELTYDLGDSAASVAGGIAGSALSGMALGSVAGPVGTVVGFVGGVAGGAVGCALASEAYATAVELGSEGAEAIAKHARQLAHDTSELVKETAPEKFDEVKAAFDEFFEKAKLPLKD